MAKSKNAKKLIGIYEDQKGEIEVIEQDGKLLIGHIPKPFRNRIFEEVSEEMLVDLINTFKIKKIS